MKRRICSILLALTFIATLPSVSMAAKDEDDKVIIDARLEGYKDNANMSLKDAGGTALTWLLMIALTGMSVGVMFMNAKRSHLD